jgi:hypothetical protein
MGIVAVARVILLSVAVLVPAHDLVYLAAYGPDRHAAALSATGHGSYWTAVAVAAFLGLAGVGAAALHRSRSLRDRLATLGHVNVQPLAAPQLVRHVAWTWLAVMALSVATFAVQENVEHLAGHGHLPALGVLTGGEYQWALPIFGALALAVATAGSVTVARLRALTEAVARALHSVARPTRQLAWPWVREPGSARGVRSTPDLGRAPPALLHI